MSAPTPGERAALAYFNSGTAGAPIARDQISTLAKIIDEQTAAPEMLAALKETRKALRSAMDRLESAGMRYIVAKPEYLEPMERSRVAITKGEGRS